MADADPKKEVETLRERIEDGERGGSEADREVLLEAADGMALRRSEVGAHRRLKILRHGTRMAEECGGLAEALNDRDAAEEIVRWIHSEYENEHTDRKYRTARESLSQRLVDG
jgi:hypothetical protein